MSTSYKPDDYSTVSPYLVVDGAAATIDFLERAFGATEVRRFADESGKIMHAEVRIDDTIIMLADRFAVAPKVGGALRRGNGLREGTR